VPVIIKHAKTGTIADWTQADLDQQIAAGNYPPGTVLADIVLPSDWNNDHTFTGLGTMAEQDANNVAITGGTINNTTIGATTATTGVFTTLTVNNTTGTSLANIWSNTNTSPIADLQFTRGTTSTWGGDAFTDYKLRASGGNFVVQSQNNATSVLDLLTFDEANNAVKFSPGGIEQARVSRTASAVNYVQVTGGATTAAPVISTQGSDSNIALSFVSKGTARHNFFNNGATSSRQFAVGTSGITSAVNFLNVDGSVAGIALPMQAQGTDTNISMAFQPKGTGAIDLAAGSSGVNISNGGTVTAITRTNAGANYTSKPILTISAPTTAGGVQAVATLDWVTNNGATVQAGGTGYAVGNVLTVVGGTPVVGAATLTVATVSSGVITSVNVTNFGSYVTTPTNPVSVTGGTGSGATFNLIYSAGNTYTFSNAGSGYIEQPTVTFSGGGGSGAAAYATVGSATIFRSLAGNGSSAQSLSFHSSSGESLRVTTSTTGGTSANFIQTAGGATGNGPRVTAEGSDSNIFLGLVTKGTGAFQFLTNLGTEQMRVSHTASAVNYVQVTGSATGGQPTISAQGSDANVILNVASKNNSPILFFANGSEQFRAGQTGTAVNSLTLAGGAAGLGPSISSRGSDPNVNLNFSTKGTGGLIFYTNNGANAQFQILDRASSVNYCSTRGGAAGSPPTLSAVGSDTDINLSLVTKGTGRVQFGTYTASILTPTGYVEIVDSGGTVRRLLVG
jgi:hypothetical protein